MSDVFTFHGIILTGTDSQELTGDCPFCEKAGHFYVNTTSHQWECKRCSVSGNKFSFLKQFHQLCHESTTITDYKVLAENRGITDRTLVNFNLALNPLNDVWLIPTYNLKGKIINLHAYNTATGDMYSTPTCNLSLFNIQTLSSDQEKPLYLTEGHWDCMMLDQAFRFTRKRAESDILAVPGASCFKESFTKAVANRNLILLYDNDQGGMDGVARVIKVISKDITSPSLFSVLDWEQAGGEENIPEGYDIRDLHKACGNGKDCLEIIDNNLLKAEDFCKKHDIKIGSSDVKPETLSTTSVMDPLNCKKFSELMKYFGDHLYFTRSMQDVMAVMLATNLSIHVKGNPLWFYIIGPPSSGKTTLANCLGAAPDFSKSISKFTGLFSGFKDDSKEDASLITKLDNKTLLIKDFTSTLTMPGQVRENLYGELREAFDGQVDVHYRNRIKRGYTPNFAIIACVTDEIRSHNTAALGERFLQLEILDADHSEDEHMNVAFNNTLKQLTSSFSGKTNGEVDPEYYKLQQYTYGFLKYKHQQYTGGNLKLPTLSRDYIRRIKAIASLIGKVRAKVKREFKSDLAYRPTPEIGARLSSLLLKLATFIAFVMDKKTVDKQIFRIVKKVAMDTGAGFQWDILQALSKHKGLTIGQLSAKINLSESTVKRRIIDMIDLRLVESKEVSNNSGHSGRNAHLWVNAPKIRKLFNDIKVKKPRKAKNVS